MLQIAVHRHPAIGAGVNTIPLLSTISAGIFFHRRRLRILRQLRSPFCRLGVEALARFGGVAGFVEREQLVAFVTRIERKALCLDVPQPCGW